MVDAVKVIKSGDRKVDEMKNSLEEMVNAATKPLEESVANLQKSHDESAKIIAALGLAVVSLTEDTVKRNEKMDANDLTMKSIDYNLKQIKNELRNIRHRNERIQRDRDNLL